LYVNAIERMPPPAPEMAWMAASEEAILGCLTDVKGCERRRAHTHLNKVQKSKKNGYPCESERRELISVYRGKPYCISKPSPKSTGDLLFCLGSMSVEKFVTWGGYSYP
jgi:hypothetical protein